jgi:hypothetical protein
VGLILSLAVRRKGIARCAALHLDCARFADGRHVSVCVGEAVAVVDHCSRIIVRAKFVEVLARYSL